MNKLTKHQTLPYGIKKKLATIMPVLQPYQYNISVSHSHKLVWFRVAKVGTRTILDALDNSGVDIETRHPRLTLYPSKLLESYTKAAFVRNPWDRLVSAWQNKVVDSNLFDLSAIEHSKMQNFDAFIEYLETLDVVSSDIHIRPQSSLIDVDNLDYLGHFETFEHDVLELLNKIGIDSTSLPKKNASNRQVKYRAMYSDRTERIVAEIYRDDITTFGYSF